MPREVNSTQSYADKLVKLVPTEIVGAYMVLSGMIGVSPASSSKPSDMSSALIIVVSIILLALTPIYLMRIGHVKNVIQIVVTTLSFAIWVYTLGGPFAVLGIYYPIIASIILVLWQMIVPLIVTPQEG
jgi:hypothetical protein